MNESGSCWDNPAQDDGGVDREKWAVLRHILKIKSIGFTGEEEEGEWKG